MSVVESVVESFESEPDHRAENYLAWYESTYWPCKRRWPGLVGDCIERASCIIKYATPYHVQVHPYKVSRKMARDFGTDPLRVILFVDQQGFVATTPRVG
jgi:hypothetical protein